jgi:hypothetical protein
VHVFTDGLLVHVDQDVVGRRGANVPMLVHNSSAATQEVVNFQVSGRGPGENRNKKDKERKKSTFKAILSREIGLAGSGGP